MKTAAKIMSAVVESEILNHVADRLLRPSPEIE